MTSFFFNFYIYHNAQIVLLFMTVIKQYELEIKKLEFKSYQWWYHIFESLCNVDQYLTKLVTDSIQMEVKFKHITTFFLIGFSPCYIVYLHLVIVDMIVLCLNLLDEFSLIIFGWLGFYFIFIVFILLFFLLWTGSIYFGGQKVCLLY